MEKVPKRFPGRQNYVVKKISDFPIHESDGTEILLVEVNGKLYQMQPVNQGPSSFSIEYLSDLPETGALNTLYIVNKTDVYFWDDVNLTFIQLNIDIADLVNSMSIYFQIKSIKMTAVAAETWIASEQFESYNFECNITAAGVTINDVATVVFDSDDADSGNYARVNITDTNSIRIFSKVDTAITVRTIEIHKY